MTKLKKPLNNQYTETLKEMWNLTVDLYTYSENKYKEIFRLASQLGFYARQAQKVTALREVFSKASKEQDIRLLKSIKYKAEHSQEEKSFEYIWDYVSSEYDRIIKEFCNEAHNPDLLLSIPTADEIWDNSRKMLDTRRIKEVDELIQVVKAEIDL